MPKYVAQFPFSNTDWGRDAEKTVGSRVRQEVGISGFQVPKLVRRVGADARRADRLNGGHDLSR
jgi:hypothetical protein